MHVLFIGDGYEIRESSWCSPHRDQSYPTLSEAKRQCSDDPLCTMLVDSRGKGNHFYLCNVGAQIKSSTVHSILYIKRRECICCCTSSCNASNPNMAKLLIIKYN